MFSLLFSFLAALFAAFSNLIFRKSDDSSASKNSHTYLLFFYISSALSSLLLYPHLWHTSFNGITFALGCCVGILNVVLMSSIAQALKKGPAGLTFAFQNASAIFPGVILFLLFGTEFGYSFTLLQFLGFILVILALFIGVQKKPGENWESLSSWLKYVLLGFLVQVLALTLIQGRCILFDCSSLKFLSKFTINQANDAWFMPGQFGAALLLQSLLWRRRPERELSKRPMVYGSLAGIANFGSTAMLLLATKLALPTQKVLLFPLFAVATILLCNIWANRLYAERFNFKTNLLFAVGIFLAAL